MKMDAKANSSGPTLTGSATKRVSFADLVGLKLEFVKTITPCSSEENLIALGTRKNNRDVNGNVTRRQRSKYRYLCPCFVAPSRAECSFMERVFSQNVSLENIACDNFVVAGLIRGRLIKTFGQITCLLVQMETLTSLPFVSQFPLTLKQINAWSLQYAIVL